jgi:hypothetical protein
MDEKQKEAFRRFMDVVRRSKALTDKVKDLIERGKPITEIAELMKPDAVEQPSPPPPPPPPAGNDNVEQAKTGRPLGCDPVVMDAVLRKSPRKETIKELQRRYEAEPGGHEISYEVAKLARQRFRRSGSSAGE